MDAPNQERAVIAGANPGNVDLKPCNYLVVAELEDGNFIEVFRHVPREDENCYSNYNHARWESIDGTIVLPAINIVPFDNTGMILCGEFWIDEKLVSEKRFFSVTKPNAENLPEMSLSPMLGIDHEMALKYCELLGLRLPTSEELDLSSKSPEFQSEPKMREWTSRVEDNVFKGYIQNPLYLTWSLTSAIPTEKNVSEFGFRTARSTKPLRAIPMK